MARLVSTQYLYVSSANSMGLDNADVSVEIPEDSMRCGDDEYLKLSVSQFSTVCNMYNVTDGNNMVTYSYSSTNAVHNMEAGNYRVSEYVDAFNAISGIGVTCTYRAKQNTMRFQNTRNVATTIKFQGNLAYLFGFRPTSSTLVIPASSAVDSTYMIVPRFCNDLVIKIGGIMPGPSTNISNLERKSTTTSPVLGIIPLRAAPGQLAVYYNVSDVFSCQVHDSDIQKISFFVCDTSGAKIQNLPDWIAVIKVDTYRRPSEDVAAAALNQLVEYARLGFLNSQL